MHFPLSYAKLDYSKTEALQRHKELVEQNENILRKFGLEFSAGKYTVDEYDAVYDVSFDCGTIDLNNTQRNLYMQLLESFAQTWKECK